MKTILAITLAILTFAAVPATAKACDNYRPVSSWKPYVVCTEVVGQCRERHTGYDSCGNCCTYFVTVITYRDVFSDGSTQRYTRTFRA